MSVHMAARAVTEAVRHVEEVMRVTGESADA
jgi:hypothetical protein